MRRYPADSEVGLPQLGPGLTTLGASPETPFNEGIFTQLRPGGFSRGVFTPDPPWATPRYIATTPEGVDGFGSFDVGGVRITCDPGTIIKKLVGKLPSWMPYKSDVVGALNGLAAGVIQTMMGKVAQGEAAFRTWFMANVAYEVEKRTGISQSLLGVVTPTIFGYVKDVLNECKESVAPSPSFDASKYPHDRSQPDGAACVADAQCYSGACQGGKCVNPLSQFQMTFTQKIQPQPQLVTIGERGLQDLATKATTSVLAAKNQCWDSGGAWFDGGAMCDVNPTTKMLENCRAPYPPTYAGKKYNCVPKGTPGSVLRPTAAGKSSLPLILGAAAVAALVLASR
jgi:hypothetical protein